MRSSKTLPQMLAAKDQAEPSVVPHVLRKSGAESSFAHKNPFGWWSVCFETRKAGLGRRRREQRQDCEVNLLPWLTHATSLI